MKKVLLASLILNLFLLPIAGIYFLRKYQFYQGLKADKLRGPAFYFKNSSYWTQKKTLYDSLKVNQGSVVFVGNSIIDNGKWDELLNKPIINRAIQGDNTEGLLARISQITKIKPSEIYLMIGTNDLTLGYKDDYIVGNYKKILDSLKMTGAKVSVFSILPRRDTLTKRVPVLNSKIEKLATLEGVTYIKIYPIFADKNGLLATKFTNDGLHLLGCGYVAWANYLRKYYKM